jgi:hypothetical protein
MFYKVSNGGTLEIVTFSAQSFTLSNQTEPGTSNRTFTYTLGAGKKAKYVGIKSLTASANQSGQANGASVVSFSQSGTTLTITVGVVHGGNHNFPQTVNYSLVLVVVC